MCSNIFQDLFIWINITFRIFFYLLFIYIHNCFELIFIYLLKISCGLHSLYNIYYYPHYYNNKEMIKNIC